MSSWRGILSGSLVLVALQASLSSDQATNRVGRMFGTLADGARRLIDPAVAAIPDLAGGDAGGKPKPSKQQTPGGKAGKPKADDNGDDGDQVGPDWAPWNWNLPPGML